MEASDHVAEIKPPTIILPAKSKDENPLIAALSDKFSIVVAVFGIATFMAYHSSKVSKDVDLEIVKQILANNP